MSKFKTLTHWIAAGFVFSASWVATHPDRIAYIVKAFPKLSGLATALIALFALYHSPNKETK